MSKLISIVTGCFNEEDNVEPLYERLKAVTDSLKEFEFEIIYIDNASTDGTIEKLRTLAKNDKRVKVIINMRNFGALRSLPHGMLQASGEAVIAMASDLQDPPELLPELIKHWQAGALVVAAVKTQSEENFLVYCLRTACYKMLNAMANIELIEHYTGFGLYDKRVIDELRKIEDNYPYFRGLICELGFKTVKVPYLQAARKHGKTKGNFYHLYDLAMLGLTSHTVVPMRIATWLGFTLAIISAGIALFYLIYKLIFWPTFPLGLAPLIIGMFGMFSIQLVFIGLIGEYIAASHRHLLNRPAVVERERLNFEPPAKSAGTTTGASGDSRNCAFTYAPPDNLEKIASVEQICNQSE